MPEPYSDEEIAHYEPPDFDRTTREIRAVIEGSLRLKATIDADRKKIVDYKNMLNQRAACYIKAKQEVKGLKNRIAELEEENARLRKCGVNLITLLRRWVKGFSDAYKTRDGFYVITEKLMKDLRKQANEMLDKIEARAAQGEKGEKK